MADSETFNEFENEGADVDMGEEVVIDLDAEGEDELAENGKGDTGEDNGDVTILDDDAQPANRVTFADYLKSPIVELVVGGGEEQITLTAHKALLVSSPYFENAIGENSAKRRVVLENEDLDAVGCFLEYLYTGEYFPQKLPGSRILARDPTQPELDATGEQLLKHARVYSLAEKIGMPALKTLAHSKIHCVNSSAKGELAYAKYVYATTSKDDETIRKPVASFWAHRSHVLRSEVEDEFRQMCLEFPQFGFDVLTRVLDEKLKTEKVTGEKPGPGSSRKRHRNI